MPLLDVYIYTSKIFNLSRPIEIAKNSEVEFLKRLIY